MTAISQLFVRAERLAPLHRWIRVVTQSMVAFTCSVLFLTNVAAQNVLLVPAGSIWKYRADGVALPEEWRAPDYDDSLWSSGATEIGRGDGGEATLLSPAAPIPITTYYRTTFDVANPGVFTGLLVRLVRDDGAVVYLNGREIFRSNMRPGKVSFDTVARSQTIHRAEGKFFLKRRGTNALAQGRNVLAVEVHQFSAANDDTSFDLELVASATKPATFIVRGPYLQNASPTSATIRWRTDVPAKSHVRFGATPIDEGRMVRSRKRVRDHEVTVENLEPDTQYFYRIGNDAALLAGKDDTHFFRTPPAHGTAQPVRVWVLGDCGTGGMGLGLAESVRDGYLRSPLFRQNDVWLMLGDNAYDFGRDEEYQAAVFDTYPTVLRNTFLWSTIGNHEIYAPARKPPYFKIFTLPRRGEAGGVASGTPNYYSFDYADIHFVCLDSMQSKRSVGSPMLEWLAEDLAATSQKWIIAFWHHAPYSKGSHDSDIEIELVEMRENVVPILEAGGVDLVLTGHSHSYERSMLIDGHYGHSSTFVPAMIKNGGDGREDGDGAYQKTDAPHDGAVYVVSGTAGVVRGGTYDHPVMVTSLPLLGSLILDIDGDRLLTRFIGVNGEVLDHFSIIKP